VIDPRMGPEGMALSEGAGVGGAVSSPWQKTSDVMAPESTMSTLTTYTSAGLDE